MGTKVKANIMKIYMFLVLVSQVLASPFGPGFGRHGFGYPLHGCKRELKAEMKKFCSIKYEKECTTETKTFTKITDLRREIVKKLRFVNLAMDQLELMVITKDQHSLMDMLFQSVKRRRRKFVKKFQ